MKFWAQEANQRYMKIQPSPGHLLVIVTLMKQISQNGRLCAVCCEGAPACLHPDYCYSNSDMHLIGYVNAGVFKVLLLDCSS